MTTLQLLKWTVICPAELHTKIDELDNRDGGGQKLVDICSVRAEYFEPSYGSKVPLMEMGR